VWDGCLGLGLRLELGLGLYTYLKTYSPHVLKQSIKVVQNCVTHLMLTLITKGMARHS